MDSWKSTYEFNECVFLYGERKDVIHPDTISYGENPTFRASSKLWL